jgi:hypothetical protein
MPDLEPTLVLYAGFMLNKKVVCQKLSLLKTLFVENTSFSHVNWGLLNLYEPFFVFFQVIAKSFSTTPFSTRVCGQ